MKEAAHLVAGRREGVTERGREQENKRKMPCFQDTPPVTQWKGEVSSLKVQWCHQLWTEPLTPEPFEGYTLY